MSNQIFSPIPRVNSKKAKENLDSVSFAIAGHSMPKLLCILAALVTAAAAVVFGVQMPDTNEVSYVQRSSTLYRKPDPEPRKVIDLNDAGENAETRVWLLTATLALGATLCVLLGSFYFLLRRQNNSLENVVEERTKSLNKAMRAATAADRAKSELLEQINHEIRNPLTAILGYCDLLSSENDCPSEYVAGIESCSLHLQGLVEEILDVSRMEAIGLKGKLVEFFPERTTTDIYGIMAAQAGEHGLHFECNFKGNPTYSILSDETKIRQIAINLVGNAIKFTNKGNVIASVELHQMDEFSHADLVIEVSDTGIGIAKSESETVFERFAKASNGDVRDGSGLGLSITKRLAEGLGGNISLVSDEGVGTRVRVVLPVEIVTLSCEDLKDPASVEYSSLKHPSFGTRKRVLIVDDHEMIRDSLALRLQSHGLRCETVCELTQTMFLVDNWRPDLVLLDLRMPGRSGFEVLEAIRKLPNGCVPIYAMTGDATVRVQQKCQRAGFDGFIGKPFEIESVLKILEAKEMVTERNR